ncbi:phage tail protein I [Paenibacillus sp. UNC451MF]|uniref:phage tail protein I n=1 Tax=Paenibacillus sp. UNC451MF TaxID=1449063 RepID=UPI0004904031|nr:phage tail protein I [Paenibacillus sp. UNC451MF]
MINLDQIQLINILPPNLRNDPNIAAAAKAIDGELQDLNESIRKLDIFSRLDTLEAAEIDELAWQYHVDFYDASLPLETKRLLVKNSYAWHRRKGTPSAVEELITTIFGDGQVEEWYDFGGEPYTFRVVTTNPKATNEQAQEFIKALNSVKNERSWLESIQVSITDEMNLHIGGVLHIGEFMTIKQVV